MSKPTEKSRSILRIIAGFLTLLIMLVVLAPHAAMAGSTTLEADPCVPTGDDKTDVNKQFQNRFSDVANQRILAGNQIMASLGTINASVDYCLNKFKDILQSLASLSTNPFNPVEYVFNMLLSQLTSVIVNMIAQTCAAVIGSIKALEQNILNSICIPLPSLNLGFGGLSTLGTKPCNGISAGQILGITPFGSTPAYNYRRFDR